MKKNQIVYFGHVVQLIYIYIYILIFNGFITGFSLSCCLESQTQSFHKILEKVWLYGRNCPSHNINQLHFPAGWVGWRWGAWWDQQFPGLMLFVSRKMLMRRWHFFQPCLGCNPSFLLWRSQAHTFLVWFMWMNGSTWAALRVRPRFGGGGGSAPYSPAGSSRRDWWPCLLICVWGSSSWSCLTLCWQRRPQQSS